MLKRINKNAEPHGVTLVSDANDALDYLDGINGRDRTILENAIISKFGTVLIVKKTSTDEQYEEYVRADVTNAVQKGRVEIFNLHCYKRFVQSMATLFTEKSQSWRMVGEGERDDEDSEKVLFNQRKKGQFNRIMTRADRIACALGSSVVWVNFRSGSLRYQVVAPQNVSLFFARTIDDDGVIRKVDTLDIEDASAVVISLGSYNRDNQKWSELVYDYIAYIGSSEEYPLGRCCSFQSSQSNLLWTSIPDVGGEDIIDILDQNGIAYNPLTVMHIENPEKYPYEYPISILYGTDSGMDETLLPLSGLSLFNGCLELDMSYSRIADCATKAARGIYVLTNEHGMKVPGNIDEGILVLMKGQGLEVMGQEASNSKSAADVHTTLYKTIAESWGVPSYEVLDEGVQQASGIAIALRAQPKIEFRRERFELNKYSVERIFEIEKAFLSIAGIKEIDSTLLWDCGQITPPRPRIEIVNELEVAKRMGLIDNIEAIRVYYNLPNRDDAKLIFDQMNPEPVVVQEPAVPGPMDGYEVIE